MATLGITKKNRGNRGNPHERRATDAHMAAVGQIPDAQPDRQGRRREKMQRSSDRRPWIAWKTAVSFQEEIDSNKISSILQWKNSGRETDSDIVYTVWPHPWQKHPPNQGLQSSFSIIAPRKVTKHQRPVGRPVFKSSYLLPCGNLLHSYWLLNMVHWNSWYSY